MEKSIENTVVDIIKNVDPGREDLLEKTPARVARSCAELLSGYEKDVNKIASTFYESSMDETIILKNILFESICEHHMLPMIGTAAIGYIPNGKIIGASKLASIVDCFAHRLQLQERLTMEVACAVEALLQPKGVAVHLRAEHFCILHRGVKKSGALFVTKYFIGEFKHNHNLRAEFLAEIK
ncbi:MAG: GTP cyclohydrolase I FolE [Holosporaceae bacterium]|jgi:GTP cyclohydrolase I|nr:GTP cyclohydrolase I FolE [Holosporaceae bacterium]